MVRKAEKLYVLYLYLFITLTWPVYAENEIINANLDGASCRAGCLQKRFWVSRSRHANVSSRSRTLKVSENGHVSIETWKNFGFETAFRSLIRKQQRYLPDVFKEKHCAWFAKTFGNILFRPFCFVVQACRIAGFCFLFVSSIYENWSIHWFYFKPMHSMVIYSRPGMSNLLIYWKLIATLNI